MLAGMRSWRTRHGRGHPGQDVPEGRNDDDEIGVLGGPAGDSGLFGGPGHSSGLFDAPDRAPGEMAGLFDKPAPRRK
jgi:hypothetical protein